MGVGGCARWCVWVVLAWRLVVFEALMLLPRQPITFIMLVTMPRVVQLWFPAAYPYLGWLFDADATVSLWLASVGALAVTGSLRRDVLWPREWRKKSLGLMLLVLVPGALVFKWLVSMQYAELVETEMRTVFPLTPQEENGTLPHAFSWRDSVLDTFGGRPVLTPSLTLQYKTVEGMDPKKSDCSAFKYSTPPPSPEVDAILQGLRDIERGVLKLDVYKPFNPYKNSQGQSAPSPILLHVHGGGWKRLDRSYLRVNYHGGMPHRLLDHGFTIVSVSYRLSCADGMSGPDQIQDVADAIRFVEQHAADWGADGSKIVPWGTSAGGNLVMSVAYKHNFPSVKGVISLYGVPELREEHVLGHVAGHWSWAEVYSHLFVQSTRHLCARVDFDSTCFEDMSPAKHVQASELVPVPTLFIHGESDPLVFIHQVDALAQDLRAKEGKHVVVRAFGSHDCDVHVSSPCAQATMYSVDRFVRFVIRD